MVVLIERRRPQLSIHDMFYRKSFIRPVIDINKPEFHSKQSNQTYGNILAPFLEFDEYSKYQKGLISVIITTYNNEKYIKRAIDSILNQSYQDFEIIVVDDASKDGTADIVKDFNDPRILFFQSEINCGTYYSKNFGIQQARGEFIAIQDSDDYSDKFRLEKQVKCLNEHSEYVITKSQYIRVDAQGKILIQPRMGFATSVIRRVLFDVIGYYDSVRVAADDEYDCRIKAIFGNNSIGLIKEILYFALDREDSLQYIIKIKSEARKNYEESFKMWHKKMSIEERIEYLPFPLMERPFLAPDNIRIDISSQTLPQVNISRVKIKADKTTATIASIPQRRTNLSLTINSIIDQFDRIYVYLNDYENIPAFLQHPKITVARSQDFEDLADNGKFFWCSEIDGYHFTLDDDIVYPRDYVMKLTEKIRKHQFKVIVGVHGIVFNFRKFKSYYDSNSRVIFNFNQALKNDSMVDILGTGTMAYHTKTIRFDMNKFENKRMVDIYVSIQAQESEIPRVAVERPNEWLIESQVNDNGSIYYQYFKNDTIQTELVKKHLLDKAVILSTPKN
jgi:glycosyltransferase involved in cell wall biosynthesis